MAEQTTQTPTTEETKTPETTSTTNLPGAKTIEKIASIPAVTSIFESAKSLYSAAKDYSPLVKSSLETVEASVDSTVKFVKPNVVDPLLNSQTYKKYAEPTLNQVDEFGVKSIETIEKLPENLNATYQHSKEAVETKVSQITTSTLNTVEQKVTAVDTYLKGSVIGAPMEKAIDVTEKLVDQYLIEKKTITEDTQTSSEEKETMTTTDGPLLKAGKLSKKIQHQAFEKLKKLSLRSNESVKSMEYVVDLIQYAANHLDSGVKTTQTFLNQKGGEIAAKSTEMLEEKKKQLHEAKDSLQKSTQDALAAVVVVAKEVAKQTKEFPEKTYHALEERVGEWKLNMESITDMSMFHSVATKSLEKLNEIKNTVISSGSTLPASVTESVSKGLHAILDSLMSLGGEKKEATKESKEEFTPQPAPVD